MKQLSIFDCINAYQDNGGCLSNEALYDHLITNTDISRAQLDDLAPIGKKGELHSPVKRQVRWYQQTLKAMGVLERVERGVWQLCEKQSSGLHTNTSDVGLVAFSTNLGIAIWGSNRLMRNLHEPIALCVTSPPYPLRKARAYGGPTQAQYTDFIVQSLEPIVKTLLPGGSIVLNLTNDSFEDHSPARSLYLERLVLALHDDLGLSLMDRIPWLNRSKPPAPTYWACRKPYQLVSTYEHILWFTNDPMRVRSNNRAVLLPHTEKHAQLQARGGENRNETYGDGAYRIKPGDFGTPTAGRLPRNVIERGHRCTDTLFVRTRAKELGLQPHGAMFPTAIPDFFIRLLTQPEELVVDPFGGAGKTAIAAERTGRRWMIFEWMLEYARQGAELFRGVQGFHLSPCLESIDWGCPR